MKDTISLTVPMDYLALTRASDMLHGLAMDLKKDNPGTLEEFTDKVLGDVTKAVDIPAEQLTQEPDAATAFGTTEQVNTQVGTAATTATETTATPAPAPAVDLDKDGLPWDARINPASKARLKKTDTWKLKRGIDPELVKTVHAELRAAMAATPANPIPPAEDTAPTAGATAQANVTETLPQNSTVQTADTPAAPPAAVNAATNEPAPAPAPAPGGITTLPELMAKITSSGIAPDVVLAAVNRQGLASIALLGARPDLIPAVAAELFPAVA